MYNKIDNEKLPIILLYFGIINILNIIFYLYLLKYSVLFTP